MSQKNSAPQGLQLSARTEVMEIVGLTQQAAAMRGAALDLDAAAVSRIGALYGQFLISIARTWRKDRKPLRILNLPESACADLKTLGLLESLPIEGI